MQTKRTAAAIISAVLALTSITASAEWLFAGYDTRDLDNIGKVYNEVIGGKYTNKTKVEALDPDAVEWKTEGYEKAYPHAGYDRMYIEGNKQAITRYNNLFPQWETRFQDYFWEIWGKDANAHRVYQRQQTKIPGLGWTWDYGRNDAEDATLFVPTTREIAVDESFKNYGVGPFTYEGKYVSDEVMGMYYRFLNNAWLNDVLVNYTMVGGEGDNKKDVIPESALSADKLSARDPYTGQYVMSDEDIAGIVGAIQSKVLTGPSYRGDSGVKDVAAEYLKHGDVWAWDADSLVFGGAKVSWTGVMYEIEEPYKLYQYLIVNGIVFDGSNDLPRIWRYTGGNASPKVEWKYVDSWKVADDVMNPIYNVVEWKYVDGKLALDPVTGEPIFRIPTGEYAPTFVKTTATEIQLWITNDYETKMVGSMPRTPDTLGYYGGYMGSANYVAN